MGELPAITDEEHGELYDALVEHPLGAIAVAGITRDEYIQRKGQVEKVVVEDENDKETVLAYVASNQGFRPVADFLAENT